MRSKMNECDESLRSDSLKNEFLSLLPKKSRGQGPHCDRRNNTPLRQRGHIDGSTMETHSRMECLHMPCVRAPVAGASNFGTDSSKMPRQRPVTVSRDRWLRALHRWTKLLKCASTADCLCSLPSGDSPPDRHSHDRRAHEFRKGPVGTRLGYWLQEVRLTPCVLCAYGGPRPLQRIRGSSKQNLRQWSPSHSASLLDGQAPWEHHV